MRDSFKLTKTLPHCLRCPTHQRRGVFYFTMRKFHDEIRHYLKHKDLYKSTCRLCWDPKAEMYITTFWFTQKSTFEKMGLEVIL